MTQMFRYVMLNIFGLALAVFFLFSLRATADREQLLVGREGHIPEVVGVHFKRHDLVVNFAQTLLQVAYWWHPLLWLANSRLQRLRLGEGRSGMVVGLRQIEQAREDVGFVSIQAQSERPGSGKGRQRVEHCPDISGGTTRWVNQINEKLRTVI